MRRFKKTFNKAWATFHLAYQDEHIVVYSLSKNGNKWYEVFQYKVKPPNNIIDEEYEAYPSNEDFGKWAWSCSNIDSVKKVLEKHFKGYNRDIPSILVGVDATIDF